ncbi:MAG: HAD-superfamily hydrolase, phosphatase [Caulobacteraceae bacterium]|nr:HAD-superfamily hydrolase, phosphatase [Caulobacteraceae bacterium]
MAIEAVIWDFGGVFTTSPFEAFNRFEQGRSLPADLIRGINATNPDSNAWALFERAEIDAAGFDAHFLAESTALGYPVRGAEVLPLLSGDVRPAMVEALKLCKTRFKVGCITNNMAQGHGPGMQATREGAGRAADIMALFDAVIESSKAGVRKPDPRIYQMMCELLDVAPAACVYLDDLGVNCKPAAALGMTAIKVVTEAQALADLARVTGIPGIAPGMEPAARASAEARP